MKKLFATIALSLACTSAQAVDLTITLTAGQETRFLAACGKAKSMVDNQTPPQPRACTRAEGKQMVVEMMRHVVVNVEQTVAIKAATDAINVPAFDPQ